MVEKDPIDALVGRAQDGDREAMGELLEIYQLRLRRLIESQLGTALRSTIEVDDVIQESFSKAVASIDRFVWRGEDSFLRWLGGIAHNFILNAAKTQRRRQTFQLLPTDRQGSGTSPSGALRRDERFGRFQAALDLLTPEQREIVRLIRIDGLKVSEAAEQTNRSPEAVKQLMLRALKRLRTTLRESGTLRLPDRPLDLSEREDA